MAHLSEETLTLLALGEASDPRSRDHLASCPECTAELASLERVVRAGRARATVPAAPGPAVWAAIHAELGLSDAVAPDPLAGTAGADAGSARTSTGTGEDAGAEAVAREDGRSGAATDRGRDDAGSAPEGAGTGEDDRSAGAAADRGRDGAGVAGATVVDLGSRRRSPRRGVPYPLAAAAAAAALVVGGAVGWGIQRTAPGPEPTVLATAELEPLAGWTARGSAEVDERPDGTRHLVVRTDPADVEGFKEVWLLAPDAQRMVSLGVMAGDEAEFVLPEALDVGEFPIVDISDEPVDGDPTHSGDSIVRGALEA